VHGVDLQHITHGSACFDLLVPLESARWGVSRCTLGVRSHPALGLILWSLYVVSTSRSLSLSALNIQYRKFACNASLAVAVLLVLVAKLPEHCINIDSV